LDDVGLVAEDDFCEVGEAAGPQCETVAYVSALHDRMPAALELDFVDSLRRFSEIRDGTAMSMAFTVGGDLWHHIDNILSKLWNERYGIYVNFARQVVAHADPHTRTFLAVTSACDTLLSDDVFFRGDSFPEVPGLHSMAAMAPADRGKTQKKFIEQAMSSFKRHKPEEVIFLVPTYMTEKERGSTVCGVQTLLEQFRDMSYWAAEYTFEEKTSQRPTNERTYIVALSNVVGSHSDISAFFSSLVGAITCVYHSSWCVLDKEERKALARSWSMPPLDVSGPRRLAVAEDSYKLEHCNLFRGQSMKWPLDHASVTDDIDMSGMNDREKEVAVFVHTAFPDHRSTGVEFIDAGQRLARICKTSIAGHDNSVIGNPWVPTPPPSTLATRLLMRYKLPGAGKYVVRLAEPFELMLSIGFTHHMLDTQGVATVFDPIDRSGQTTRDVYSSIALSSGAVSHYTALRMAALSTSGRFHSGNVADVTPAQQPGAQASQCETEDVPSQATTQGDSAD